MSIGNVVVSQDAPAKNNLWIQPKGTARFWNGSIWKVITGNGGGEVDNYYTKAESDTRFFLNSNINGVSGYAAKFTGTGALTYANDYIRIGNGIIYWDAVNSGFRIYHSDLLTNPSSTSKAGIYADWISALGANNESGSGGGGGIDITDLFDILNGTTDISEYTGDITIATKFLGNALTELTKQNIETVLTGNITSHTHNQYLTEHQDISGKLNTNGSNATTAFWNLVMNEIETELGLSIDDSGYLHSSKGFYSDSFVSALGLNSSGGSGGGGMDLDSLWDALSTYDNDPSHVINSSYIPNLSGYLQKSGGTMTGSLVIATGVGISDASTNGMLVYKPTNWTGISSSQWGVGAIDCPGVIRTSGNNLYHYKDDTQTSHLILDANNYNSYTPTKTGTGASGTWEINVNGKASKLSVPRNAASGIIYNLDDYLNSSTAGIFQVNEFQDVTGTNVPVTNTGWCNVISYNGNDANYGVQILNRLFDYGFWYRQKMSGNFSTWIKILDAYNYSSYALPLSGGTLTGVLNLMANQYNGFNGYALNCNNSDIVNVNSILTADTADSFGEGICFYRSGSGANAMWDCLSANGGTFYFGSNKIYGAALSGDANINCGSIKLTNNGGIIVNSENKVILHSNITDKFMVLNYDGAASEYLTYIDGYDIRFRYGTGHTEGIRLTNTGNVGIGISSPTEFLHLYKPSAVQNAILFQNSIANVLCGIESSGNGILWNRNNNYIRFGTNATERMRILANGSVAIAQTETTTALDVYGTIRSRAFNANGRSHAAFVWDKAGSNLTGVGSNDETDTIYFGACDAAGTWISYSQLWKFGGSIYATGAVTALATSASDRRLKKDIKPFNARAIIDKLNPVQFYWNDEAHEFNDFLSRKELQHGLIAQDSDGLIDGFVFDLGNGTDYKGIHYEKLTPILLQAVKEQQVEIDNLKKELLELKDIVKQLINK